MDPFPAKPKGMYWRTYEKLESQANWWEDKSNRSMLTWLVANRVELTGVVNLGCFGDLPVGNEVTFVVAAREGLT